MARASKVAWMGVMVGLAIEAGAAGAPRAAGEMPPAGPGLALPAGAHSAFNNGMDSYRRADYEMADKFFKLAQAGQADLAAEERQQLTNLVRINNAALKARREGADQVRQAERAIQAGRLAEGETLLRSVAANQFLAAEDKVKAQQLGEQVRPDGIGGNPARENRGAVSPAVLARTKLQQARQLMAKANYDTAEALAHEVQQLKVAFRPGEDTPLNVLNDIARVRSDVKRLVSSARVALQCGDLDRAENLAKTATKSGWSVSHLWGDSPAKILKDVQIARARQGGTESQFTGGGVAPTKAPAAMKSPIVPAKATDESKGAPINQTEAAHHLLRDGRSALKRGDLPAAKECTAQAQALDAPYHWWEDTPAKLEADIRKAEGKETRAVVQEKTPAPAPVEGSAVAQVPAPAEEDPRAKLKNARDLFNADNYDAAEKVVMQVRASGFKNWGLFDDNPEKLLGDIRAAKAKHTQAGAARALREARSLFEKKDYEAARAQAYKAEKLHGPYSVWDLGDRPSKLIAEIDAAQDKGRLASVPTPTVEVARKDSDPVAPIASGPALSAAPTLSEPKKETAAPSGVQQVGFSADGGKEKNPFADLVPPPAPLPPPAGVMTAAKPAAPMPNPVTPPADVDVARQKANNLMAEARHFQRDGRLVEARQKALEAQKVKAHLNAEDDRPEQALLELADLASRRIEHLQQEAADLAATAMTDPARFPKAEENLVQAKLLAQGFAFDSQAIDTKMTWIRQTRQQLAAAPPVPIPAPAGSNVAQAAPAQPMMPPAAPLAPGQEMLNKARMELKRGELETARRLAIEVYTGKYGLQAEADAMLHSIDAEEFNQKVLIANRSFEAGLGAYVHKDYAQASTIFRSIDLPLLAKDKQAKLKELMLQPELKQSAPAQVAKAPPMPGAPGKATATDAAPAPAGAAEDNYAKQVHALQEVQFQKLREDGLKAQREATSRFGNGETAPALDILQEYLNTLKDVQLEPEKVAMLQRPVEARLRQFKKLKAQQDFDKEALGSKDAFDQMKQREFKMEEKRKKDVAELMKQYHALYEQGKYAEAEMSATQAHELDPDNTAAAAAMGVAKMHRNMAEYKGLKGRKEEYFRSELNEAEDPGQAATMRDPLKFDDEAWKNRVRDRKAFPKDGWGVQIKSEKEREIEHRLGNPISLDFKDQPLKNVIDDLRDLTGINIVPDMPALEAENISLDRPITMHLEGVSTKAALTLVLHQAHLIYVIQDEVVKVTTAAYARGKLVTKTYQVADLVIPVENYTIPDSQNLTKILNKQNNHPTGLQTSGATPFLNQNSMRTGTPVGSATAGASPGDSGAASGTGRTPGQTLEDVLIKMVTSSIAPESWSEMGGPGTIEYYPLGMALVINQTPDIQEQVADLLTALRKLQDMEVTVEVRIISIAESFFERIGVDFNINIQQQNTKFEPLVVSNNFQPLGFNNTPRPSNFITGLIPGGSNRPGGVYTSDLNVPILNSSFGPSVPPFGGFPNTPGSDGGLSLGLAFLSDIQVFMFLEAAQGDRRTNIMQAPKLTLFNGQSSTLTIGESQFFVTDLQVFQVNGQVVFAPQNNAIPLNISLAIQAVVSADRRYVRLNLNPRFTNLATPVTTALFPVTTFITPVFENGAQGQPVPFTQYLQQPNISNIDINTTVMVPDGGTVLLGGLKTLREGRNEFGPPILSKLPYVNRLFKNVGYGREAESLMLMVTPRIIINDEEETRQTGVGQGLGSPGAGPAGVAGPGGAPIP